MSEGQLRWEGRSPAPPLPLTVIVIQDFVLVTNDNVI
jgi:hypothetical protein